MTRAGWLAGLLVLLSAAALADGTFPSGLKPADRERLQSFDEVRAATIAAARAGGAAADRAVLDRVLEGEAAALPPGGMAGNWRCRTLKLGGKPVLVVYAEFRCRITDDAAGLRLEKLTGSQRTSGTLYDLGEARLGYAGAEAWGADEAPRRYGQDPARDQVGYLVPVSQGRMRLELPLPRQESRFDILALQR
ncbi:DUF4893 domain-containing protein [Pseudoroseomonas globiformis]|uniref:DUF4893 domain-containing protein n=1 Tax=Teichococcus globiformis TaxID=2307229 RepID=A0ABV7FXF4_9PROT